MDTAELRKLAAEREARRGAAGDSVGSRSSGGGRGSGGLGTSAASKPQQQQRTATAPRVPNLSRAHRSIRMAHSVGCIICALALFLLPFPWVTRTKILLGFVLLAGCYLARAGGGFVHNCLPALLVEGNAPSPADIEGHNKSLFTPEFTTIALTEEWEVLLENLAFCCTYGKRNCLTNQMYSGPVTLGKICSLVWGKLKEGVIRC